MRYYGSYQLRGDAWYLDCEPHVRIKLKQVFPKLCKTDAKPSMRNTPEAAVDLEWFCQRYPLRAKDDASAAALKRAADGYRATMAELEKLVAPGQAIPQFDLAIPPREYQATGAALYLKRKVQLNADVVGLGKTFSGIIPFTDKRTLPALVLCETHLVSQWIREIKKFLPRAFVHEIRSRTTYNLPPSDIYICSYTKINGWGDYLGHEDFSARGKKPILRSIVLDEVQSLRHPDTAKYKAVEHIRANVEFCQGLSASPIHNYGGEIFNIMEIIAPGELGSREEFYREHCHCAYNKYLLNDPAAFGSYLRGQHIFIRRTRAEVSRELPPVQRIVQSIPTDEKVLKEASGSAIELAKLVLNGTFTQRGQAARDLDRILRQATGISKAPFVADFVRMLVDGGEKVLLGGWHREVYAIWEQKLKDLKPVYYTGTENEKEKKKSFDAFTKGDSKVMFLSLRSGVGLDGLQVATRTVVFGELDWSPAIHEQFIGRAARDGCLDGNVSAFFLVSEGGIDPVMANVLQLKANQSAKLLDPSTTGLELATGAPDRMKQIAEAYLRAHGQKA